VRPIVAWVTAGFVAPGARAGSGSPGRAAAAPPAAAPGPLGDDVAVAGGVLGAVDVGAGVVTVDAEGVAVGTVRAVAGALDTGGGLVGGWDEKAATWPIDCPGEIVAGTAPPQPARVSNTTRTESRCRARRARVLAGVPIASDPSPAPAPTGRSIRPAVHALSGSIEPDTPRTEYAPGSSCPTCLEGTANPYPSWPGPRLDSVDFAPVTVLDWLLDADPAIRWQALRDLADAPAEVVQRVR
jgi:hypothetical protein